MGCAFLVVVTSMELAAQSVRQFNKTELAAVCVCVCVCTGLALTMCACV